MENMFLHGSMNVLVVPAEILDMENLTAQEKLVYIILCSWANEQGYARFPSYSAIAKKGSMTKEAVAGCVKKLEEAGLLKKVEVQKASKNGENGNASLTACLYRPAEVFDSNEEKTFSEEPTPIEANHLKEEKSRSAETTYVSIDKRKPKQINKEKESSKKDGLSREVLFCLFENESELVERGINLKSLVTWLTQNADDISDEEICFVIGELAQWNKKIRSTAGAIRFVLKNKEKWTEKKHDTAGQTLFETKVQSNDRNNRWLTDE